MGSFGSEPRTRSVNKFAACATRGSWCGDGWMAGQVLPGPRRAADGVSHRLRASAWTRTVGRSAVALELTFLGDPLECLAGALDAILIIIPVRRQQLDDLIAAAGTGPTHRARGEIDGLSDRELVGFQLYSPARKLV